MKYLKLYEEFKYEEIIEPEVQEELPIDKSKEVYQDKPEVQEELPIDKSKEVYQDNRGVYHIKNWAIY
jgi:hypothetical protein